MKAEIVRKKGRALTSDPLSNKGMAFPCAERDRLSIRGLLPSTLLTVEEQSRIILEEYDKGLNVLLAQEPDEKIIKSGVSAEDIRKWKVLQSLQDRNETLFYKILMENFLEMAPIIYTPTVGWACTNFSHLFRRPRGMFFSPKDRGEMASMVYNWDTDDVDAIVVTDGSRVLGLGDLGIGGLAITIGKLDLYVAAGGFHPRRVLPVVLDVGTNNPILLQDPHYIGLKKPRLEGEAYYEFVDEFMAACNLRWPKALIQFEDFQSKHAITTLLRYRHDYLMFNDDIQGTAATVLAGLYGALAVRGLPKDAIKDQTFVVCGAGSAGSGVILTIKNAMTKRYGLTKEEAGRRFYIMDEHGLITKGRKNLDEMEKLFHDLYYLAADEEHMEGWNLLDVVREIKPDALIGLSAVGGLFSEDVLTALGEGSESPIIFPLSNPTSRSECTAEQAQRCTGGRAIFASGSPYEDVEYNGVTISSSQCNNRYIFPGLALGSALGQTGVITNPMINRAAEALVELLDEKDLATRATFPDTNIREVSCHLAARVIEEAMAGGQKIGNKEASAAYKEDGLEGLKEYIYSKMWNPNYRPLVYLPPGKGE